jgi:hypothetical protein
MHGKGGGKGKVSDERRECLGSCRARLVTTRYARDPVVDRRVETTEPPIVQDASISPARKTVMVSRHVPFPVAAVVPVPVVAAFISRSRHGGNGVRVEEGRTRAAPRVIWSSLIRRQKGFGQEAREHIVSSFISVSVRPRKRQLESQIYVGAARTTTRAVHAAQHVMVAEATRGVETRARKRKRDLDAQAGVAIPGLSFDVVVSIVEKHLPDPADLAVLRAVSKGMRDAVDATGRKVEDFGQYDAAERGYLSTLKCLRRRGVLKDERLLCAAAARSGQLEALKALRAENLPWDERTCCRAANGGHLEVLKWARANGCPWDWLTCAWAAGCGHLEVLKWARDNGCPWDENTCADAAWRGHLEVLKWARENGCPWDELTCEAAAARGHLEVLKWARENGCPWDELTCELAASMGYVEA